MGEKGLAWRRVRWLLCEEGALWWCIQSLLMKHRWWNRGSKGGLSPPTFQIVVTRNVATSGCALQLPNFLHASSTTVRVFFLENSMFHNLRRAFW